MLSVIVSILAIGFIIMFHEFGHFLVAKYFGVSVVEFSIGMGPRLCSFVKGDTRYSLRAFPFGGSCMMLGEELDEAESEEAAQQGSKLRRFNNMAPAAELTQKSEPIESQNSAGKSKASDKNSSYNTASGTAETNKSEDTITVDGRVYSSDTQFARKPAWQRFHIILAGPVFNFILAFVLSMIITISLGWPRPVIVSVTEDSAACEAGIEAGDTVTKLTMQGNSTRILTANDIMLFFEANSKLIASGEPVTISFKKPDGSEHSEEVYAKYDEENDRYLIGISYSPLYEPCENIGEVFTMSFHNLVYTLQASIESIRMMVRGEVGGEDVKGVVGMVAVMDESVDEAAEYGLSDAALTLINIMMLLSASLGFMNLLPLPALDGGRLVFILIEMITGKAVPKKIESYIHFAGMILLLALTFIIMFKDILDLF